MTPELGQALFSNSPWFDEEAPTYVLEGLSLLGEMISDGEYGNDPSGNVGAEHMNGVFHMRSYCWCDGERGGHEQGCPPNFIHKRLQVRWYKYLGRSTTISHPITRGEWWEILKECVDSVFAQREESA